MITEPVFPSRTVLVVDDEANIVSALKRTLRRDGYIIHSAHSAQEGLALLAVHDIGVIISDQRMPQMTGVEFFRAVKDQYPNTMRIILSGYTELESVTSAINEGAIFKFLTKPWDDDLLRRHVSEAFQYYEMEQENRRLHQALQHANAQLSHLNQTLEQQVIEKIKETQHSQNVLQIAQEVIEHLPVGVIGLDQDDMIVLINRMAEHILAVPAGQSLLGNLAQDCLPISLLEHLQHFYTHAQESLSIRQQHAHILINPMGESSHSSGSIIVLSPLMEHDHE